MSLLLLFLPRGGGGGTNPPTVTTDSVTVDSSNQATAYGNVTDGGSSSVTERGFVVSTSANPTTGDTKFTVSGTTGSFSSALTSLSPSTTYHVRAFATNSFGTSYGTDLSFTTEDAPAPEPAQTRPIPKHYIYRIFDQDVYAATWTKEVISEPKFRMNINGGPGEMVVELARPFDDFGEDVDIKLNNKVEVWVVDKDSPNGTLLYSGYISGYEPTISEVSETVSVTILGYVAELQRMILRDSSGNTTLAYNSYDPSNILKDVIDKYRALGGSLNYNSSSIVLTNTVVSYTFNTNSIKEVFDKVIELCPVGWFFRIDPDGLVYLQPMHVTADHTFTLGLDVERLSTFRRIEDVVNTVFFTGAGSPALFKKYENTGSQGTYGKYEKKIVDQRVSVAATAQIISEREIEAKKDPEIRSVFTIIDNNGPRDNGYNIESIKPGQTLRVKNLRSATRTISLWDVAFWDTDVWDQTLTTSAADIIQIVAVEYTPDSIKIEASSRLPQIAKRIEDIQRNLENSQTVENPAAPS